MVQDGFRQNCSAMMGAILLPLLMAFFVVLFGVNNAHSQTENSDYFYQKEELKGPLRNSCSQVFADILKGKPEDVGGVIRNLKYINVDYLLRDYDNALSSDPRKNYLQLDDLINEVEAAKREIYCKIELAIYMKNHEQFAGPGYDELLASAFLKLEETYASAAASFSQGEFERARYAFDLIAPYKDSYVRFLDASEKLIELPREAVAEVAAETPAKQASAAAPVGPIGRAAAEPVVVVSGKVAAAPFSVGAIRLAARIGAITAALEPTEKLALP